MIQQKELPKTYETWKSITIQVYCSHALAMLLTKEIGLLELLHAKVYFNYFLKYLERI